jgi:predicted membrane chloride channel (bestrophin family)
MHAVLVVSILVGLYHEWLVPLGWPKSNPQLNTAMGMVTTCLSLLLVFRTNSECLRACVAIPEQRSLVDPPPQQC